MRVDEIVRLAHVFALAHAKEEETRKGLHYANFMGEDIADVQHAADRAEKKAYIARCDLLREFAREDEYLTIDSWAGITADWAGQQDKFVVRRWQERHWAVAYPDGETVRWFSSGAYALEFTRDKMNRREPWPGSW